MGEAHAETGFGRLAHDRGEHAAAREHLERGQAIWQRLGKIRRAAVTARDLAVLDRETGQWQRAESRLRDCLTTFGAAMDRAGTAHTLGCMADLYRGCDQPDRARELYKDSLHTFTELGLHRRAGHANALHGLGTLALGDGEAGKAVHLLTAALEIWHELDIMSGQARTIGAMGEAHAARGDYEVAARMRREARELSEVSPVVPAPAMIRYRPQFT
jgi:uncharacterized protein HemY